MDRITVAINPSKGIFIKNNQKKSIKRKDLPQVILRVGLAVLVLIGSGNAASEKFCTAPEYNTFVVKHLKSKSKDKVF